MKPLQSVVLVLVLVQVLFGTLPIAIKFALRDLSSPALTLLRVGGAALLFILISRLTLRERIRSKRDYALLAFFSLLGVSMSQLAYIAGVKLTTATAAQTLVAAGPALTLLAAILLHKENGSRAKWVGILFAGSGALILVGVGLADGRALGNVLVLGNVIAYSVYLVISRELLTRYDPLTVITWVFIFGMIALIPFGIAPVIHELPQASGATWAALIWIVLFPTVATYYLNLWALKRVEASLVATFVYLQPLLTALLAIPLLGERPSPRLIPGALLIFAGVTVTIMAGRSLRPKSTLVEVAET